MKFRPIPNSVVYGVILLGLLSAAFCITLVQTHRMIRDTQSPVAEAAHAMGLAMYSYANDNSGNYPTGKNSTEVCQKLADGGYVNDPWVFCVPGSGKIKAEPGQKLKPENVSWDVTADLRNDSPGDLPLLFLTGYRVNYSAGGAAVPLPKPSPASRIWNQWWNGAPKPNPLSEDGAVVFYVNNSARWMNRVTARDGTSSIPNFISPDYKPDGKTYRQLTPDGVLPP